MPRIWNWWCCLALAACAGPAVGPPAGGDDPISAPAETWSWVPFPDSACGNGEATGLGVNLTGRSTDVVIWFQGGGACWDGYTCLYLGLADHLLDGYGAADFAAEPELGAALFDRAAGPFRDASFVFVPYCTGDLHAGDSLQVYEYGAARAAVRHAGAHDADLYLRRLAATFPGARRVFAVGASAGGYAVQLLYPRLAAAFPDAEVHALADSAQLVQPTGSRYATWQAAWGWSPPAACTACPASLPALAGWLAGTWPDRRLALLASTQDETLRAYFNYPADGSFDLATRALLRDQYPADAAARWFAVTAPRHGLLADPALTSGGVTLSAWLAQWYAGDPAWASVGP